jgi:hypothetical protein
LTAEREHSTPIPWSWALGAGLAILAAAAWWRLAHLGDPGLWLDEILGVRAIGPEHGPLYYAAMRATTGPAPNEALTRLPFAIAGLLSIVAAFVAGRAASGPWLGVATAAFVATSPIHIYYSREARPYAFLLLCGFAGLYAIARAVRDWHPVASWLPVLIAAVAGAAWTSANGVFVGAALLAAGAWAWPPRWGTRALWLLLLGALAFATVAIVRTSYPPAANTLDGLPPIVAVRDAALPLIGPMVSGHREQAPLPTAAWLGLGFALAGAVVIGWRAPRLALALLTAAVLGLALPAGTMLWLQHGISARYALATFPPLALLIAGPFAMLDRLRASWARDGSSLLVGAVALLVVLGFGQASARRAALAEKADWRKVAAMVMERSAPGDTVLVSNDWSEICLGYYVSQGDAARKVVNAHESLDEARAALGGLPRALLVSAGTHFRSQEVPQWMRTFPGIWNSAREDISLSFYPDRAAYLATAVTAREVAADEAILHGRFGSRVDMTVNAARFLLAGWHDAEVYRRDTPFRWADANAVVYLPIAAHWPSELATRVRPHPRLVDRRLEVWINGVPVGSTLLTDEWTEVRVAIPRSHLKQGANMVELRSAEPPAPYDRGAKAVQAIELR